MQYRAGLVEFSGHLAHVHPTHHFHSWFSLMVRVKRPSANSSRVGIARYQYRLSLLNTATCQIATTPWQANTTLVMTALMVASSLAMTKA